MNRRALIQMFVAPSLLAPFSASAEVFSKRPAVAFLGAGSKVANRHFYDGFPQGLRELGYVEGRNYAFTERYADGDLAACRRWRRTW